MLRDNNRQQASTAADYVADSRLTGSAVIEVNASAVLNHSTDREKAQIERKHRLKKSTERGNAQIERGNAERAQIERKQCKDRER